MTLLRLAVTTAVALLIVVSAGQAGAQTVLTGDRIDGVALATRIDDTDLAAGQSHRFFLRGPETGTGQTWLMPVVVVKGAQAGPRLLITTGVHGDELNGMAVVHDLLAEIDPSTLRGTLIAVPGVNTPGLTAGTRQLATRGVSGEDLNRVMPGDALSGDIERRYAAFFWQGLNVASVDAAIDLHTQSAGIAYGVFVFVDPRRAGARRIADMLAPDFIKLDLGEPGTVETELIAAGVDAVTFELGESRRFQPDMIARGLRGVRNVMMDLDMMDGTPDLSGPAPFVAPKSTAVRATRGGYARMRVAIGDDVAVGQTLAVIEGPFGDVVETVTSTIAGRVSVVATDPITEPGGTIARILSPSNDPACANGC